MAWNPTSTVACAERLYNMNIRIHRNSILAYISAVATCEVKISGKEK